MEPNWRRRMYLTWKRTIRIEVTDFTNSRSLVIYDLFDWDN